MSGPVVPNPPVTGEPPKTKWSPKVILAGVAAFVAPAAYLTVGYLMTDEGKVIYSSIHPVFRVLIGGLISSAAALLAGYVKRDPLRELGARVTTPKGGVV